MNEIKEYCKIATLESLRYLADECIINGDYEILKEIISEIQNRLNEDQQVIEGYCKKHANTNEGSGTEKIIETSQGKSSKI